MFKGKYCTLTLVASKVQYKDALRLHLQPRAELIETLRAIMLAELDKVEEMQKAIAELEAHAPKAVQTVTPKRYPPGASGIKKPEA